MALDAQDWQRVSVGGLHYVGSIEWSGSGAFDLPVTLVGLERSILVLLSATGQGLTGGMVGVIGLASDALRTYQATLWNNLAPSVVGQTVPIVSYCNPQLSTAWRVHLVNSDPSGAGTAYVFTDTALPERVLATQATPIPSLLIADTVQVGVNHPLPVRPPFVTTYVSDSNGVISLPNAGGRAWWSIDPSASGKLLRLKRVTVAQYAAAATAGEVMLGIYHTTAARVGGAGAGLGVSVNDNDPAASATFAWASGATLFTTDPGATTRVDLFTVPVAAAAPFPAPVVREYALWPDGTESPTSTFTGGFAGLYIASTFTGSPTFTVAVEWTEATS